tara:strand:- start:364 stop:609 length:246 start_codon:yes stop_codon:yes gene_type:complete
MRSDIYGTEIDNGLQTIVESMHPTAEIAAQALAKEDAPDEDETADESSCNTKREGKHASDEDVIKCPHCDKLIQASSCGSH